MCKKKLPDTNFHLHDECREQYAEKYEDGLEITPEELRNLEDLELPEDAEEVGELWSECRDCPYDKQYHCAIYLLDGEKNPAAKVICHKHNDGLDLSVFDKEES